MYVEIDTFETAMAYANEAKKVLKILSNNSTRIANVIASNNVFDNTLFDWDFDYACISINHCEELITVTYDISGRNPGRISTYCGRFNIELKDYNNGYVFNNLIFKNVLVEKELVYKHETTIKYNKYTRPEGDE